MMEKFNQRLTFVLILAVCVNLVAGYIAFNATSFQSRLEASREAEEVANCRSFYVAQRNNQVAELTRASTQLHILTIEGLEAFAVGNRDRAIEVAGRAEAMRHNIVEALAAHEAAAEVHRRMMVLANTDREHFLEECATDQREAQ